MAERKINSDLNFGSGNTLFINHVNNWLYGATDKPYLTLGSRYSWPNVTIRRVSLGSGVHTSKVRLIVNPLFDWQRVPDRVKNGELEYTLSSTRGNIISRVPDLSFGNPDFVVRFQFDLVKLIRNAYSSNQGIYNNDTIKYPINEIHNGDFKYIYDVVNRHSIDLTEDKTWLFYSWPLYLKIFISNVKMAQLPLGKLAVKFPVVIRDNGAPYLEDTSLIQVGYSKTGHFFGNSIK